MPQEREDINSYHKVFITQKVIVQNKEGKILVMRRTETAPSRPLGWDIPGGSLQFGEDPMEGIIRETKEEAGIVIQDVKPVDVSSVLNPDNEYWVRIGYVAQTTSEIVTLSFEHDQYKWVTKKEFLNSSIPGVYKRFAEKM